MSFQTENEDHDLVAPQLNLELSRSQLRLVRKSEIYPPFNESKEIISRYQNARRNRFHVNE